MIIHLNNTTDLYRELENQITQAQSNTQDSLDYEYQLPSNQNLKVQLISKLVAANAKVTVTWNNVSIYQVTGPIAEKISDESLRQNYSRLGDITINRTTGVPVRKISATIVGSQLPSEAADHIQSLFERHSIHITRSEFTRKQ